MNSKEIVTTMNHANHQKFQTQNKKQKEGGVTYLIVSLIAFWLVEQFIGKPKEIEI